MVVAYNYLENTWWLHTIERLCIMDRGIFTHPQTFRAWVRFSGPGPYITPDIDDVGFMSISAKLMGIPGPKLMDDEKFTQDMFGVSTPTFVTPDVNANAQLQTESVKNTQIFYFLNLHRPHVLLPVFTADRGGQGREAAGVDIR